MSSANGETSVRERKKDCAVRGEHRHADGTLWNTCSPARINEGMFTSATEEWSTPDDFFTLLDAEFGFTLDVCATAENAKCPRYFTKTDDGLAQDWGTEVCWMNPPYGRVIGLWVKKAFEQAQRGATVVCLIPSRTDTAYWHDYAMKADEIRLVRGRLHFGGGHETGGHNAPFPQAVVVFRPAQANLWPTLKAMGRTAVGAVA